MIRSDEFPDITELPEEHPLTIDMDEYPYIVEEILDKRLQDGTTKMTEYLVKWFGYAQDEATWEPEKNLPAIVVQEYEQDMEELETLAGTNISLKKGTKKSDPRKNSQTSLPAQSLSACSWQARRKQRLEQLLSRKLKTIKSIRLRDGTLEFLCLWHGEACAQIVPRAVLMMRDDYKQKLLEFYEKFVVLARPSEEHKEDEEPVSSNSSPT